MIDAAIQPATVVPWVLPPHAITDSMYVFSVGEASDYALSCGPGLARGEYPAADSSAMTRRGANKASGRKVDVSRPSPRMAESPFQEGRRK